MGSFVVGKTLPGAEVGATRVEALARLAVEGDTAAMTGLLRALAPEMARVVRGVMGSYAADVDDALQQSLVAVVQALPAFRGDCSPEGYACRIAFRTALAVRKRVQVAHAHARKTSEPEPLVDDVGMSAEARQRARLLRELLDALPPDQAEALALRTMLGWSLDEIARVAGVPLNTVRSRMRLAKEALRARIESDPSLADELGVSS